MKTTTKRTTTHHRYTAANTPLLATVRRIFNAPIYKHVLALYNAEGERATLDYLQQYTTTDIKLVLGTW